MLFTRSHTGQRIVSGKCYRKLIQFYLLSILLGKTVFFSENDCAGWNFKYSSFVKLLLLVWLREWYSQEQRDFTGRYIGMRCLCCYLYLCLRQWQYTFISLLPYSMSFVIVGGYTTLFKTRHDPSVRLHGRFCSSGMRIASCNFTGGKLLNVHHLIYLCNMTTSWRFESNTA